MERLQFLLKKRRIKIDDIMEREHETRDVVDVVLIHVDVEHVLMLLKIGDRTRLRSS